MQTLQEWMNEKVGTIPADMLYKKAGIDQMCFFRDQVSRGIFKVTCMVSGEHVSKSVLLPMYRITRPGIDLHMRDNFYDTNVVVHSDKKVVLPARLAELIDLEKDYLFFEGMEPLRVTYAENKKNFAFCVSDRYLLWTILFFISHGVVSNADADVSAQQVGKVREG